MKVNMYEARTKFSHLVARVEAGEEITIARAGRPVARLVPVNAPPAQRRPGTWADHIWTAEDFDDPIPEDWISEIEP